MSSSESEPSSSDLEPSGKKIKMDRAEESNVTSNITKSIRKFRKIPIFIVDYHNDVLEFVYRCFGSRYLPLQKNTIVHFDSHPDMVIARDFDPKICFHKTKLLEELSIENWIMPTCYAGHFDKIVWIKNSWCKQIDCGEYKFNIGDCNDEIQVDLPIPYFLSEGNYCEASEHLLNKKEIHLNVMEIDALDVGQNVSKEVVADEKEKPSLVVKRFCTGSSFILDIDLDYFSTANPFLDIYDKVECYRRVTEIFDYKIEESSFAVDYANRKLQLENLKEIFQYLDENRSISDEHPLLMEFDLTIIEKIVQLIRLMKENYIDRDIDWMLVYNAGCTSDNCGLPHHLSNDEMLNSYFGNFEKFLKCLDSKPIAVTIARSTEDGYCPADKVDHIQNMVLKTLQNVYGESMHSDAILHYEEQQWNIMDL